MFQASSYLRNLVAASLLALVTSLAPLHSASGQTPAGVQLERPRGGWNVSGLVDDSQQETAAYPYNLIDRGQQTNRTLIKGQLQQLGAQRHPQTAIKPDATADTSSSAPDNKPTKTPYNLIINGNPMPLYTGADGRFIRPYVFGPGSNSVEVKAAGSTQGRRVQFYERNLGRPTAALRAILSWDDNQAEVDLHVITPDGQHAFFGQPILQGGGGLDVDSVDGAGPEMFSIAAPKAGVYHFYVNYWGNFSDEGYHFNEATRRKPIITVQMTLVTHENTPQEKRENLTIPLRKIGDLTHIKSVAWH